MSGKTPKMKGTPMNKVLKDGSKWKEDDLNKFGIQYDTRAIAPLSIFQKIQNAHVPSGSGPSAARFISELGMHVETLQQVFDEIFDLQIDLFELMEIGMLMNSCRRDQRVQDAASSSSWADRRETERHRHDDDDHHDDDADIDHVDVMHVVEKCIDDSEPSPQKMDEQVPGPSMTMTMMTVPPVVNSEEVCAKIKVKATRAKDIGRGISAEINRSLRNLRRHRVQYEVMFPTKSNILNAIQRVEEFLESLSAVLGSALDAELNEMSFVNLFQDFARIFCVQFKQCGVKRYLRMGKLTVTSVNDLRYDYVPIEVLDCFEKRAVVTVGEVKPTVKKKKITAKRKLRTPSSEDSDDDDIEFSPELRGQHGVELLADLGRSCLTPTSANSMILGMTVEATMVRLTCLDVLHKDFKEIQEKEPENAAARIGTIYYTKAFDMLTKDGRKNLIFILRHLLFLSQSPAAEWLPRA